MRLFGTRYAFGILTGSRADIRAMRQIRRAGNYELILGLDGFCDLVHGATEPYVRCIAVHARMPGHKVRETSNGLRSFHDL